MRKEATKTMLKKDELSEEDRRALRGSKFAPLPSRSQQHQQSRPQPPPPRLAHPGGPLTTNKAAALAKFLERKLQQPNGLANINPQLIERAVDNAKHTVTASGTSTSGRIIRHVSSFDDSEEEVEEKGKTENAGLKKHKKKKKKMKKRKKQKVMDDAVGP